MIKKMPYLVFAVIMFCGMSASAQLKAKYGKNKDKPAYNKVYFEAFGSALQWSLNYERDLGPVVFRVGGGYANGDYLVPTILSYKWEKSDFLAIQLGVGALHKVLDKRTFGVTPAQIPDYELFPTFNLAATFRSAKRGPFLKVAFTPILDLQEGTESYFFGQTAPKVPIVFWGGVSFGLAF